MACVCAYLRQQEFDNFQSMWNMLKKDTPIFVKVCSSALSVSPHHYFRALRDTTAEHMICDQWKVLTEMLSENM